MKKTISIVVAMMLVLALGFTLGQRAPVDDDTADKAVSGEREILYYKAPMDSRYRSDSPGKSPMGMDLVPVYADEASRVDPGVVSIDPGIVNNLGVRSAPAEKSVLSRRIETVGYVGYDEDTIHHVHTRADGWIEKLSIKASGDPVTRGQVLFEFYSPTLVNAQEEYLATLESSNAPLRKASRQRLAAFGVSEAEIKRLESERKVRQRVPVYAMSDGFVVHLGVREGIYITAATDVMSIAELDSVWVLVEVFERQAAWVQAGQRADVTLDYLPGETLHGVVDYVYPAARCQNADLESAPAIRQSCRRAAAKHVRARHDLRYRNGSCCARAACSAYPRRVCGSRRNGFRGRTISGTAGHAWHRGGRSHRNSIGRICR